MNNEIEKFHNRIIDSLLKIKKDKDLERYHSILAERKKWIDEYTGEDRNEMLLKILDKDKEIEKLIQGKLDILKEQILQEEEMNRNRMAYKLYE